MQCGAIKSQVLKLPEVAAWPLLAELVEALPSDSPASCLDYPLHAARAVGGEADSAIPAATAIYCLLTSIHLIDDMLDSDPDGLHHRCGEGATANLAAALQAVAHLPFKALALSSERLLAIQSSLAHAALATAYGQQLDLEPVRDEEAYWRVVEMKTPPLFSAAIQIGALLGGASMTLAEEMRELGVTLGKLVQISDDLLDAMASPAGPDWAPERGNNLAILYATQADHSERADFIALLSQVDDPRSLAAAQQILIRSGAVSYCVYHLLQLHQAAREQLQAIELQRPESMEELLAIQLKPLAALLRSIGFDEPFDLL